MKADRKSNVEKKFVKICLCEVSIAQKHTCKISKVNTNALHLVTNSLANKTCIAKNIIDSVIYER